MVHFREVLKDKNFFFLWLGQIISQFGDRLNQMALVGFMHSRSPGSTVELAKILAFTILPVFIIGPFAGVYVDRLDKRKLMIACDIMRGVMVLFIPLWLVGLKVVYPVYIIIFIVFSITRFYIPSKMSIIPDIVPQDKLLAANSLSTTTGMIASVLGFGVGGIIVSAFGVKGGFCIDGISYFISGMLILLITVKNGAKALPDIVEFKKGDFWKELKDGLKYMFSDSHSRLIASVLFLLMAGVGSVYVVIIVFIQEALKSATRDLGLILMIAGMGLFAGAVVYGKFGGKLSRIKVIFWQLMLTGIFLGIFSLTLKLYPSFAAAAILGFILGFVASPVLVSANTLLQEVVHENMRGRVFSSIEIVSHFAFLIFMFATAVSAEYISRPKVLLIISAAFSLFGLIGGIASIKKGGKLDSLR